MVAKSQVLRRSPAARLSLIRAWALRSLPDLSAAGLLLALVIWLTWTLWRSHEGVVNFIDFNVPVTRDAIDASLRNSLSPWNGLTGLGRPNVGFLGTTEFLGLYKLLAAPFGLEVGSRLLLITLVWLDALGAYAVLRRSYQIHVPAAIAGASFYILNPWVYDAISQGHLYTLEVLMLAPFLILGIPRLRELTLPVLVGISFCVALAVGSSYHFGILIVLFLTVEAAVLAIRGDRVRAAKLGGSLVAGLGLLSFFIVPYVASLGSIQASNSPPVGDLVYFSRFTSWHSAFSLLRPGVNAWGQISSYPLILRTLWSLGCVSISIVSIVLIARGAVRRLTGSYTLPAFALFAVLLANGANGFLKTPAIWAFAHIPLASIFRDPSKFLIFPLLLFVPTVALLAAGEVPKLLSRRTKEESSGKREEVESPPSKSMFRNPLTWWRAASPLVVIVLFLPFLLASIRTVGVVAKGELEGSRIRDGRTAFLPSWQFVRYPGQQVPVNDPLQIFPDHGVAKLGPDYDNSRGNVFLRWLYTSFYFRRTDSFYNLAALAGIDEVVVRSDIQPVTDNSVARQMFSKENLLSALDTQRPIYSSTLVVDDEVRYHLDPSGVVSSSSSLMSIDGSNLGVLSDLASLTDVDVPAICFSSGCPPGEDLSVGSLGNVAPVREFEDQLELEVAENYDSGPSKRWIDGRVAYAEGFGAVSEQLGHVAVGIGRPSAPVTFVGRTKDADELWIQVLRGPEKVDYDIRCGETELNVQSTPTIGGYVWAWEKFGNLPLGAEDCSLSMDGKLGAVAGGTFQPSAGSVPRDPPDLLLAPANVSHAWDKARPASFSYPGLTSTSVLLGDSEGLSFSVPQLETPRHLYAHIRGIEGRAYIRANGVVRHPTKSFVARDQRAWVDLGEIEQSSESVELRGNGGTVAVLRVGVAEPRVMARLNALQDRKPLATLAGNVDLVSPDDVTVERREKVRKSGYLMVRADAEGSWTLNGDEADGTYAGYGQLYEIGEDEVRLTSTLKASANLGAVISLLFLFGLTVGLPLAGVALGRRRAASQGHGSRPADAAS